MTITQFNKILEKKIEALPDFLLRSAKRNMIHAKESIEARIKGTGINADGQPFPPYTPEYQQLKEDVGRYSGHVDLTMGDYSIRKRIVAIEKRNKRRNKVRQASSTFKPGTEGRTSLTGPEIKALTEIRSKNRIGRLQPELWSSINIKHEEASPAEVKVVVAPMDDFNVKKSEKLSEKRGNFLRLNPSEHDEVILGLNVDYEEFLKRGL